jgi:hypothetical protein
MRQQTTRAREIPSPLIRLTQGLENLGSATFTIVGAPHMAPSHPVLEDRNLTGPNAWGADLKSMPWRSGYDAFVHHAS